MSRLPSYFCGSAEAVIVLSYRAPQHCHLPARGRLPGSHCIVLLDCLSRRDAQLFNVARFGYIRQLVSKYWAALSVQLNTYPSVRRR